ncbi:MAG TPA: metal-sensitive transcriptional regulator [Actinomycetota bacterium]|nr:metal-sensitive transcriptional regulator [Actinomycetota bacterium]
MTTATGGTDVADLVSRLRKIEGQVRGVERMLEQRAPVGDVLTQVSAAVAGMEKVGVRLLQSHVRATAESAISGQPGVAQEKMDELLRTLERFVTF